MFDFFPFDSLPIAMSDKLERGNFGNTSLAAREIVWLSFWLIVPSLKIRAKGYRSLWQTYFQLDQRQPLIRPYRDL